MTAKAGAAQPLSIWPPWSAGVPLLTNSQSLDKSKLSSAASSPLEAVSAQSRGSRGRHSKLNGVAVVVAMRIVKSFQY
jgi:hypothetical protein